MAMRLASFNLESLFDRAKALNQKTWAEGRPILEEVARLNELFAKPVYTPADKTKIVEALTKLGLAKKDDGGKFALLRQNHGKLLQRKANGQVEVVANGRGDWIGWVELTTEEVDEFATRNTAQVVRDVKADVMTTIEVDNRVALNRRGTRVTLSHRHHEEPRRRSGRRHPRVQPGLPGVRDQAARGRESGGPRQSFQEQGLRQPGGFECASTEAGEARARDLRSAEARRGDPDRGRRRLQRHPGVGAARPPARAGLGPARREHPSDLRRRRPAGNIRERDEGREDRLHTPGPRAVRQGSEGGRVPEG